MSIVEVEKSCSRAFLGHPTNRWIKRGGIENYMWEEFIGLD